MGELSLYGDSRTLDPLMLPCPAGPACAAAAETELRSLFHQLSARFFPGDLASELFLGIEPTRIEHTELFSRWVQRLHVKTADDEEEVEEEDDVVDARFRWLPFCPDLRRRIKRLVRVLLATKSSGLGLAHAMVWKRKSEPLWDALLILRKLAADPCVQPGPDQEWKNQILLARKALFLREEEISVSEMAEFPYRRVPQIEKVKVLTNAESSIFLDSALRKRRVHKIPNELSRGTEHDMLHLPKRRSQRTLSLLKFGDSHLPRKRIPLGSSFQADVPNWAGLPNEKHNLHEHDDDLRWLGTQIWPIRGCDVETSEDNIGKGRTDFCYCNFPGSVECIKFHVRSAWLWLKSDLGVAFTNWGFDEMGEEVSKSWMPEEQAIFDNIVRLNPLSEHKSFLQPASKIFTCKSKKDIVSYYFNVYVLRRMTSITRLLSGPIDSDDDEGTSKARDTTEVSFCMSSQSR
ncbi:AT-rich interactive domain-containing protein 2 [Apostasia shenzhenica]|uniref:AT-rich interactive domain-containing protein 2 n=1 Tax=Apostasia shenzhenica TaxID=1088818 RepID=A0A2I0AAC3_9ASPA|nr:AT-rich interactive domain-containing protein 2 [Apostasia shenzhenica]